MSSTILWPTYYLKTAIQYLTDRNQAPALIVDNSVLNDGVLATRSRGTGNDCVICIAPAFVANLEISDEGVSFSAKFDGFHHALNIPFEAINAVYAYRSDCMITDNGEMNMFVLPKVVLPPGSARRTEMAAEKAQLNQDIVLNLEDQPKEECTGHVPQVASIKR